MNLDRRQFIRVTGSTSAALSVGGLLPGLWQRVAEGAAIRQDNILVVVQLSGGNDGLNTVIPVGDERYYGARPTLAVSKQDALPVKAGLGLHPAARGLADLLESGRLSIVQGVGYENPNRSHFESMDIWHTCLRKEQTRNTGWLGRGFDRQLDAESGIDPAIHVGAGKQPLALASLNFALPTIDSPEEFRLQQDDSKVLESTIAAATSMKSDEELLGFLQKNTSNALQASGRIAEAMSKKTTEVEYPSSQLARKLSTVARLIGGGLETRVYYVELDGFDTHSQQAPAHESLLEQWSGALHAFHQEMTALGCDDKVTVLSFSEFGRRVAENASEGTDHGAAAPVFLSGGAVEAGVVGTHPSLEDLDDGDLRYDIDFRRIYSTVLSKWLGWDADDAFPAGIKAIDHLFA